MKPAVLRGRVATGPEGLRQIVMGTAMKTAPQFIVQF